MREYGQVQTAFWTHPDVARLGDGAKLLAVYLFTCPHSNALGCFRVPAGYISADLGWTSTAVEAHLDELEQAGLVLSDSESGWRLVPNHLKWNPIQNPNVGKAVVRQARAVPAGFPHRGRMVEALGRYGSHLPEGWARTAGGESRPRPFDVEGAFAAFLASYPGGAPLGPAWRAAREAYGRAVMTPLGAGLLQNAVENYAARLKHSGERPAPADLWIASGRWNEDVKGGGVAPSQGGKG